jgi:hypothetical protein
MVWAHVEPSLLLEGSSSRRPGELRLDASKDDIIPEYPY